MTIRKKFYDFDAKVIMEVTVMTTIARVVEVTTTTGKGTGVFKEEAGSSKRGNNETIKLKRFGKQFTLCRVDHEFNQF